MPFDHIDLRVSSLERARPLYDALMPALGLTHIRSAEDAVTYSRPGAKEQPFFGLEQAPGHRPNGTRIALRAESHDEVDRLAAIARHAGARSYEAPQLCPEYSGTYYAAFFEDADGNKFEICNRR